MYKKGNIIRTKRGQARIIATRSDAHIINGSHPRLKNGEKLFPKNNKDYVVAFENPKKNEFLTEIYEDMTEPELKNIEIRQF